jgi:hypothetical protein
MQQENFYLKAFNELPFNCLVGGIGGALGSILP